MSEPDEGLRALRIHGKLARELGLLIVSGRYRVGQLLETEMEASERYKVSRPAYREALRMLSAKGLVEARPKVGTRITPKERWHLLDPDVLAWMFQAEPDDQMLRALFELRLIIEPEAAALAAQRRTVDQMARMGQALAVMTQQTLATEKGRAADQDFHAALIEASGNPFLRTLSSSVSAAVAWTTKLKQRVRPLVRDPIPDHARVFDAIATQDGDGARAAMTELLELALFDTTTAPKVAASDKLDGAAA
jgi:DNA-binding FadR family transcriptional regulator